MNRLHHWYCSREAWKRQVREQLVPAALEGVELGADVLELGPGFGPATDVLARRRGRLTALELDARLARSLRERLAGRVEVVEGDATAMPFADASFSGVACFTMLHHVPTRAAQDRVFAEVARVLWRGGMFAATDANGLPRLGFAVLHLGDPHELIDPRELPGRLEAAGFADVSVGVGSRAFGLRARRPA